MLPDLFQGPSGNLSLVSEDFNQFCVQNRIEVRIEPFPNPGNPFRPMRKLVFRNFNDHTIVVKQANRRQTKTTLPARGGCEVLLEPGEPFPIVSHE